MYLIIGYDECLLLELFAPITRVSFTVKHISTGGSLNIQQINIHKQLFTLVADRHDDTDPYIIYNADYIAKFFIIPSFNLEISNLSKFRDHNIYNGLGSELYFKHYKLKPEYINEYLTFGLELLNFNNITENDFKIIYE